MDLAEDVSALAGAEDRHVLTYVSLDLIGRGGWEDSLRVAASAPEYDLACVSVHQSLGLHVCG